jgi:hypothetical protein
MASFGGKRQRYRPPDTAAAARNQHDFFAQILHR